MGNRAEDERNVRSIMRYSSGSYHVTLPIEFVQALKWREKQKVVMKLKGKTIVIEDWKK